MAKKKPSFSLPTSEAEVNEYITVLAEAQVAINKAVVRANERMSALKAALAAELVEHEAVIEQYAAALFAYFEQHRDQLTDGGKRESCVFATGILGQRWTPPRTQIKDEEAVKRYVKAHKLSGFFEEQVVLRRDAMLANKPLALTIPGVKFVRDRIVFVKPDAFDVEIDLKKKLEEAA